MVLILFVQVLKKVLKSLKLYKKVLNILEEPCCIVRILINSV